MRNVTVVLGSQRGRVTCEEPKSADITSALCRCWPRCMPIVSSCGCCLISLLINDRSWGRQNRAALLHRLPLFPLLTALNLIENPLLVSLVRTGVCVSHVAVVPGKPALVA